MAHYYYVRHFFPTLSSHLSSKPMTYITIIATLPTNIYNSFNKQSEPDLKLVEGGGICRLQYWFNIIVLQWSICNFGQCLLRTICKLFPCIYLVWCVGLMSLQWPLWQISHMQSPWLCFGLKKAGIQSASLWILCCSSSHRSNWAFARSQWTRSTYEYKHVLTHGDSFNQRITHSHPSKFHRPL